jgi:hypothetical protein
VLQLDNAASLFTVGSVMNATRLLSDMQRGDADAASQLLNLVQAELRQIAGKLWGDGQPGQTLQPTMLVDKAWERLVGFEGDLKKIVPTTFLAGDIKEPSSFARKLAAKADPVSIFINEKLSEVARESVARSQGSNAYSEELQTVLTQNLNAIIKGPLVDAEGRFATVPLRPETQLLLARKEDEEKGLGRLNRMLLEDAYPRELSRDLHKEQFLRFAAGTMKRILIENHRRHQNEPPMDGGDALARVEVAGSDEPADGLLAVLDAVEQLIGTHPQAGQLVKLRFYEGNSIPEAAKQMKIPEIRAKRLWEYARAWLYNKLQGRPFREPISSPPAGKAL